MIDYVHYFANVLKPWIARRRVLVDVGAARFAQPGDRGAMLPDIEHEWSLVQTTPDRNRFATAHGAVNRRLHHP